MRKALELLVGSCTVYAVVVACGQAPHVPEKVAAQAGEPAGGGEASPGGGRSSVGGEPGEGGLGGLLDPVPEAGAADADSPTTCDCPDPPEPYVPPEPIVIEAPCDIRLQYSGTDWVYAEIPRPDVSETRALGAYAWLKLAGPRPGAPLPRDYRSERASLVMESETHMAVLCGAGPNVAASATFVIP